MAKLSITVNKTRCIGSGDCVETAPAVFQLDDEGKSEVVNPSGAGDRSSFRRRVRVRSRRSPWSTRRACSCFRRRRSNSRIGDMAIRKHRAGELVIEQTRDLALVREMLARGRHDDDGIEWPAACYLVAYFGDEAVGVIGVEPKIDAALIRSLYVNESMRGRGIGSALHRGGAQGGAHARRAPSLFVRHRTLASSSSVSVSKQSQSPTSSRLSQVCRRSSTIAHGPRSSRARSPTIWTFRVMA